MECNILHHFATNDMFLRFYLRELKSLVTEIDDKEAYLYAYYAIFANTSNDKQGRRPFTLALKQNSPKCLEFMVEMLALDTSQDYMRYVTDYLEPLLGMSSVTFNRFFETSCKKQLLRVTASTSWNMYYQRERSQYPSQASLSALLEKKKKRWNCRKKANVFSSFKKSFKKVEEVKEVVPVEVPPNENELSDQEDKENASSKNSKDDEGLMNFLGDDDEKDQKKKKKPAYVSFTAYDFDKILYGARADNLIRFISL